MTNKTSHKNLLPINRYRRGDHGRCILAQANIFSTFIPRRYLYWIYKFHPSSKISELYPLKIERLETENVSLNMSLIWWN